MNSVWHSYDLHKLANAPVKDLLQGIACIDRDEVYVAGNVDGPVGGGIWYTSNGGEELE